MYSMYDALVIYDYSSKYQDKLSSSFERLDNINTIDWNSDTSKEFLEEQFGFEPKTMIVIDDDVVYVGDRATEHLAERQGVPPFLANLAKSRAEPFSTIASKIIGVTEDNDNVHGEFPLDEDAEQVVEDYLEGTSIDIN